jgi:lipopolysaccharide transport system ATP-binding protein
LRDVIAQKARNLFRDSSSGRSSVEDFWALKDVSFEMKQGEVVGIIGRNGAGKSTLLKILSRITEPTEGRVRIKGRVASLLEVGTGFHPELTGRENVFLNGAILGMTRAEIRRKFDEIVAFAEVEKFLDTPVKRYSSGMYVRLAFAVAAHLEPEILIVDEVLAVGDAEFQKKCLGKMREVAEGDGRTVLFVSHNMAAVRQLCTRGIYLSQGCVAGDGPANDIVDRYSAASEKAEITAGGRERNGCELLEFKLCEKNSAAPRASAVFGESYEFRFQVKLPQVQHPIKPAIRIHNRSGALVSSICATEEGIGDVPDGITDWVVEIPSIQLLPGAYSVVFQLYGHERDPYLEVHNAISFSVEPSMIAGAAWAYREDHGVVRIAGGMKVQRRNGS